MIIPGRIVANSATLAMHSAVKLTNARLRWPARSASAPSTGPVSATAIIDAEMTRPHHRSPSPRSLPTIVVV